MLASSHSPLPSFSKSMWLFPTFRLFLRSYRTHVRGLARECRTSDAIRASRPAFGASFLLAPSIGSLPFKFKSFWVKQRYRSSEVPTVARSIQDDKRCPPLLSPLPTTPTRIAMSQFKMSKAEMKAKATSLKATSLKAWEVPKTDSAYVILPASISRFAG